MLRRTYSPRGSRILIVYGVAMQDFPKLAAQIRGARALLGWSQAYLAEGVNTPRTTITELESGIREPAPSTLFALINELTAAGIVFTETGVEFRNWPPSPYVPGGCATIRKRLRRKYYPRGRTLRMDVRSDSRVKKTA